MMNIIRKEITNSCSPKIIKNEKRKERRTLNIFRMHNVLDYVTLTYQILPDIDKDIERSPQDLNCQDRDYPKYSTFLQQVQNNLHKGLKLSNTIVHLLHKLGG